MDGGLRRSLPTRPTCTASYLISLCQAATLLRAAFRPRLTTTPLRFPNPSPPSSWIRDFHPQIDKHAWRTTFSPRAAHATVFLCLLFAGGGGEFAGDGVDFGGGNVF